MHPHDNQLRAMIDHELPEKQAEGVRLHMAGCPACQARLAVLQARAARVQEHLNRLTPGLHTSQNRTKTAYSRLLNKPRQSNLKKELYNTMSNRKSLWTALAVITILAVVFSMTPARAWASSFLGLFRVQRIAVVEFDKLAAERGNESFSAQEEVVNRLLEENMTISEGGDPYEVASVDEAAAAAGFTPSLPDALLDGQLSVQPSMHGELVIDQPEMQALLEAFEIDVQISPEMDGQTVTVDVPAGVVATDGCELNDSSTSKFGDCTVLYQMPSPTINAPEGLNVDVLGEAMLQLLGYSPAQARAFSQNIDWTSTLLIPIPSGEGIQYEDVSVNGTAGTLFTHEEEPGYMLLWVKDGMLYGLRGPGSAGEALELGNAVP